MAAARNLDSGETEITAPEIKETSDRISEIQKQLEAMPKNAPEIPLYEDINHARKDYMASRDEAFQSKQIGTVDGTRKYIDTHLKPLLEAYLAAINKLSDLQKKEIADSKAEVAGQFSNGQIILGVLTGLALLVSVAVTFFVARTITKPLRDAINISSAVAKGDLTTAITVSGCDELSELLWGLKNMSENLGVLVGRVRSSADTIAIAAGQIAGGSEDLSTRTEQQAGSLEETASAMEELTSTVKHNADNARQANQLAESSKEVAIKGGMEVSKVVHTMESINDSSKKIADIISVIDGIAFQTNILALNAAVEAARAGEQGRGFAVVATEVRNLAQRSAAAAKEIKSLIDDSVEKVGIGGKLVDQAGTTMEEIVASIKTVTEIVGEITVASREQSSGIEQIGSSIDQLDEMTQQNASLVGESLAATQSLEDQAKELVDIVSVFKLDHSQEVAPASFHGGVVEVASKKVRPSLKKPKAVAAPLRAQKSHIHSVTEGDWQEF